MSYFGLTDISTGTDILNLAYVDKFIIVFINDILINSPFTVDLVHQVLI